MTTTKNNGKISILIADDHEIMREGLRRLLGAEADLQIVGEAADGEEAIRRTAELQPDVVIMDIAMPGVGGIDATRAILRDNPQTKVVILSMYDYDHYIREGLEAGARAYLAKSNAARELIAAIRAAYRGELYFSPGIGERVVRGYLEPDRASRLDGPALTEREREIARLIAQGRRTRQIAQLLQISPRTVEAHRAHILQKLGANSVAEIVRFAVRSQLVEP
jgi:DNA-binding NarL/FixJ family response regulator